MNNGNKNTGKRGIFVFVLCLLIALVCFGIVAYFLVTARGGAPVNDRLVDVSKVIALAGVFFLVLAFGHVLPMLLAGKKNEGGTKVTDTTDTLNEANMRRALEKYIPDGETLIAGIHAVAKESSVTCVFGECVLTENKLLADKEGGTVSVSKKKYSAYDLYIGITQRSLVVADCEEYRYYYEFNRESVKNDADKKIVTGDILLKDIGKCFDLEDIQSCNVKNGMAGSLNCVITMKNGSYFKLVLPKTGGFGGGMPNHEKYREEIVTCLSEKSK
uniref:hypothetical protein n=1 Tax=Acetatifactor sp. TaxID=1872090 RepID=UPI0040573ACB